MPGNQPDHRGDRYSPHGEDVKLWSQQIENGYLLSPYGFNPSTDPFTISSVSVVAEAADEILGLSPTELSIQSGRCSEFVRRNAAQLEYTVLELAGRAEMRAAIERALQLTQSALTQIGELARGEVAFATSTPIGGEFPAAFRPEAIMAIMLSAAIAAQRAGLHAEVGRALFAARPVLELQTLLIR